MRDLRIRGWRMQGIRALWGLPMALGVFVLAMTLPFLLQAEEWEEYFINRKVFKVFCDVEEFGAGVKNVELFVITGKEGKWQRSHSAPDGYSPDGVPYFEFTAPEDGRYGFYTVATDLAGNRETEPDGGDKAAFHVTVDTIAPDISLSEPIPGSRYRGGDAAGISWRAQDMNLGDRPITIESSIDDGETWTVVCEGTENDGFFEWSLPRRDIPNLLLRVKATDLAGNVAAAAMSPRGLQVVTEEEVPPVTQVRGRVNRRTLDIHYIVKPDVSGIKSVVLWLTHDGGKSWDRYGADSDNVSPMSFVAPDDGYFGFYIQAINNADMKSRPDPAPGTKPDTTTLVDTKFPLVAIDQPRGEDYLEGGTNFPVVWRGQDEYPLDKPIRIFSSGDSGRTWTLEGTLENTSRFDWKVPMKDGNTFRLKVSFEDLAGNISESMTGDFTITTTASPASIIKVEGGTRPPRETVGRPEPGEREVVPRPPRDVEEARRIYVEALRVRGQDMKKARALLEKAIEVRPDFPDALNDLGGLLIELREYDEALKHLKRAKELSPGDPVIVFNLGLANLRLLNIQEGIDNLIEAMLKSQPKSPVARASAKYLWRYAEKFLEGDDTERAMRILRALARLDDSNNEHKLKAVEKLKAYGE